MRTAFSHFAGKEFPVLSITAFTVRPGWLSGIRSPNVGGGTHPPPEHKSPADEIQTVRIYTQREDDRKASWLLGPSLAGMPVMTTEDYPYVSIRYFTIRGSEKFTVPVSERLSEAIFFISPSVRVKSKISRFCLMRSTCVLLGMATMPRCVSQRSLIAGYEEDMVKYADDADKPHIRECFESIPKQLDKENKKFQYSVVKKGGRASQYTGSIQWLEDAGIVRRCYNTTITELPLDGNSIRDCFKVYATDIGILMAMLDYGTQADILKGNLLGYKGPSLRISWRISFASPDRNYTISIRTAVWSWTFW